MFVHPKEIIYIATKYKHDENFHSASCLFYKCRTWNRERPQKPSHLNCKTRDTPRQVLKENQTATNEPVNFTLDARFLLILPEYTLGDISEAEVCLSWVLWNWTLRQRNHISRDIKGIRCRASEASLICSSRGFRTG